LTMGGALSVAMTFSRHKVGYRKISLPAISFLHKIAPKEAHERRILSSRLE
jgi:hypothetical protein